MRTEHVLELWRSTSLRAYVLSEARRRSSDPDEVKDFVSEAWLAISTLGDRGTTPEGADAWWHDKSQAYYEDTVDRAMDRIRKVASNAIHATYRRNRRYRGLVRRFTREEEARGIVARDYHTQVQQSAIEREPRDRVKRQARYRRRVLRVAPARPARRRSGGPGGST